MWTLSNFLKDYLTAAGIETLLARLENEYPAVDARGRFARGFDFFISQHSNAFNGMVRGSECFYSVAQPQNKQIASRFATETAKLFKHVNRGPKTRIGNNGQDFFGVIRSAVAAGCPHVFLMESGFHDNPLDELFLLDDANLKRIAKAQFKIILDVLGVIQQTALPSAPPVESVPTIGQIIPPAFPTANTPSSWAAQAWAWAIENGITDGTNPPGNVTREQVTQLFFNYHRWTKSIYG